MKNPIIKPKILDLIKEINTNHESISNSLKNTSIEINSKISKHEGKFEKLLKKIWANKDQIDKNKTELE